jgi:3-keto-L-gulonate-6-phosphate decarboxylase
MIPYYQINQIKGSYSIMLSVAGGDSSRDVQSAVFNGADIVVVWKDFIKADQGMMGMVQAFLKDIR